jgi:hypothetical protein
MILFFAALLGTSAIQAVPAQSATQPGAVSIADVEDGWEKPVVADQNVQTTLPRLRRPTAVLLSSQSLTGTLGDTFDESSAPASIRLRTTSIRDALLHSVNVEEKADRRVLRRDFASRQKLSPKSSMISPRQALLGLDEDGSLAIGTDATKKRDASLPTIVPNDHFDSSDSGMLLMSIEF